MNKGVLRVAHLTSVHAPLDTRIFHKECKTLVSAGYIVTLVAPGESDEMVDGVRIRAVPKASRRLARMTKSVWAVYRAALREHCDIYHFHDTELIPVGLLLRLQGKRVVYDVHEDLADDLLMKDYIPRAVRRTVAGLANGLALLASGAFHAIVAATPAISRRFPKRKTVVVHNYPSTSDLSSAQPAPYEGRPNRVVYVGEINRIRGIDEMVKAMANAALPDDVKLVIAGSFDEPALAEKAAALEGWERVDFRGWIPRSQALDLIQNARIGLVLFHPLPALLQSLPTKLFEYMSAGIPVIASAFPLWREVVGDVRCGILVDPLDPGAIGGAIDYLLRNPREAEEMGRRGREAVLRKYNWERESGNLLRLYRSLA